MGQNVKIKDLPKLAPIARITGGMGVTHDGRLFIECATANGNGVRVLLGAPDFDRPIEITDKDGSINRKYYPMK